MCGGEPREVQDSVREEPEVIILADDDGGSITGTAVKKECLRKNMYMAHQLLTSSTKIHTQSSCLVHHCTVHNDTCLNPFCSSSDNWTLPQVDYSNKIHKASNT